MYDLGGFGRQKVQALRHAFLQFLITKVKVEGIGNSGYSLGDILARVLDEVTGNELGSPLVAVSIRLSPSRNSTPSFCFL